MSPLHDQLLSILYDRYRRSMLTVPEAAAEAGYRVETIYRMQREGKFPRSHGRRISLADYVSWAAGEWASDDDPTPPVETGRVGVSRPALVAAPPLRAPGRRSESQRCAHVRALQRLNVA